MMATRNNEDNDNGNGLKKSFKLERLAAIILSCIIPFLLIQLWVFKDDFQKRAQDIEVRQAEIRGQMAMLLGQIQNLVENGSQTAQRTESLVKELSDRLERRVERLEIPNRR